MLRVVIDTDVIVSAFNSMTGASRQLVADVLDGHLTLLLSTSLMIEYEAVLTRPENLALSKVTVAEIFDVLDELARIASPVGFDYRWRPAVRDADDELVLETAINGSADLIATFNVRDMEAGTRVFGIVLERPASVIRRIER